MGTRRRTSSSGLAGPRRRSRVVAAAAVAAAVAAAAALAACSNSSPGHIDFFRAGPGANQVTLWIPVDNPPQPVEVSLEGEDANEVRISVELGKATPVSDKDHPVMGVGTQVTRTVTLKAPLGSRHVVGADGQTVIPSPTFTP